MGIHTHQITFNDISIIPRNIDQTTKIQIFKKNFIGFKM